MRLILDGEREGLFPPKERLEEAMRAIQPNGFGFFPYETLQPTDDRNRDAYARWPLDSYGAAFVLEPYIRAIGGAGCSMSSIIEPTRTAGRTSPYCGGYQRTHEVGSPASTPKNHRCADAVGARSSSFVVRLPGSGWDLAQSDITARHYRQSEYAGIGTLDIPTRRE